MFMCLPRTHAFIVHVYVHDAYIHTTIFLWRCAINLHINLDCCFYKGSWNVPIRLMIIIE